MKFLHTMCWNFCDAMLYLTCQTYSKLRFMFILGPMWLTDFFSFIIFSYLYMIHKVRFSSKIFWIKVLNDLHILNFPKFKNHAVGSVSFITIIRKWEIVKISNSGFMRKVFCEARPNSLYVGTCNLIWIYYGLSTNFFFIKHFNIIRLLLI